MLFFNPHITFAAEIKNKKIFMAKINNKAQVANNSSESAQENAKKLYDWFKAETKYDVEEQGNTVVVRLDTDYIGADIILNLGRTGRWFIDKIELDDNSLDTDALDSLNYEIDRLKDNIRYYNENDIGK